MKIWLVLSLIFTVMGSGSLMAKGGDNLTAEDIEKSTKRIITAFRSNPPKPILQGGIAVGETSFDESEFYATFRPSLGVMELFSCIDPTSYPLTNVGLNVKGGGHKGLTAPFSIADIEKTVIAPFLSYKKSIQAPTEQLSLILDGFSAGAHRAIETAICFKQHPETKNHDVVVLRYAAAKTYDNEAVEGTHHLLGKNNIFEFNAAEDKTAQFLNMPGVEATLGTQFGFWASELEGYKKRISNKEYTNFDPTIKPFIPLLQGPFAQKTLAMFSLSPAIAGFLDIEAWEAHHPLTYAEVCPKLFNDFKKVKKPE